MSKAVRKRLEREAKNPIGRTREHLAGRIVDSCSLACFVCDRFLGHGKHACSGVKAGSCLPACLPACLPVGKVGKVGKVGSGSKALPICHVDFRSGKMESPLDPLTGQLMPGQEKFYETLASGSLYLLKYERPVE